MWFCQIPVKRKIPFPEISGVRRQSVASSDVPLVSVWETTKRIAGSTRDMEISVFLFARICDSCRQNWAGSNAIRSFEQVDETLENNQNAGSDRSLASISERNHECLSRRSAAFRTWSAWLLAVISTTPLSWTLPPHFPGRCAIVLLTDLGSSSRWLGWSEWKGNTVGGSVGGLGGSPDGANTISDPLGPVAGVRLIIGIHGDGAPARSVVFGGGRGSVSRSFDNFQTMSSGNRSDQGVRKFHASSQTYSIDVPRILQSLPFSEPALNWICSNSSFISLSLWSLWFHSNDLIWFVPLKILLSNQIGLSERYHARGKPNELCISRMRIHG